jgi:HSP20 family protein
MKAQTSPTATPAVPVKATAPGAVTRPEPTVRAWSPWSEMIDLRRRTDDLFNSVFGFAPFAYTPLSRMLPGELVTHEPEVDIHETENTLVLLASLPGYTPEQIDVRVTAETLSIQGKRETLLNKEPITTHVSSGISSSGSFNFVYTLPCVIDPNGVKATFANGVLNLELPKVIPTVPETIKVNITTP